MLDPQRLRKNFKEIKAALKKRGYELNTTEFESLESQRKAVQMQTQELQNKRNTLSKEIGLLKKKGADTQAILDQVTEIGNELKQSEHELNIIQDKLNNLLTDIPNIPHKSVPDGTSEDDNVEVKKWGDIPNYEFEPKDHVDIGELNGMLDFESAAIITGSRFVVIKSALAQLHRALIQFMLDVHTREHGYIEVNVPYLLNSDSLFGTGQLPKFEEDLFKVPRVKAEIDNKSADAGDSGARDTKSNEDNYYLIPTAEVPLTNLARNKIFQQSELPLKFVCHSPCFRSEAGSYGKDTRGMIRHHQFEKVELVHLVEPDNSYDALEELTGHAETILQKLELPYRVVTLCAGDMGNAAAKTYDIEVWLPGQNKYREISSCSNCEDFQARRMLARWRNPASNKTELLHTLNGSGLAVGRTLIAVMENYQTNDGKITVPDVLKDYMGGVTEIG